ncbi:hypothetical protein EV426DRAFT_577568 [Tirmania nivea]|nr:hypothetical protein EV426DRAFT_577568 [Tirmania nivea]
MSPDTHQEGSSLAVTRQFLASHGCGDDNQCLHQQAHNSQPIQADAAALFQAGNHTSVDSHSVLARHPTSRSQPRPRYRWKPSASMPPIADDIAVEAPRINILLDTPSDVPHPASPQPLEMPSAITLCLPSQGDIVVWTPWSHLQANQYTPPSAQKKPTYCVCSGCRRNAEEGCYFTWDITGDNWLVPRRCTTCGGEEKGTYCSLCWSCKCKDCRAAKRYLLMYKEESRYDTKREQAPRLTWKNEILWDDTLDEDEFRWGGEAVQDDQDRRQAIWMGENGGRPVSRLGHYEPVSGWEPPQGTGVWNWSDSEEESEAGQVEEADKEKGKRSGEERLLAWEELLRDRSCSRSQAMGDDTTFFINGSVLAFKSSNLWQGRRNITNCRG